LVETLHLFETVRAEVAEAIDTLRTAALAAVPGYAARVIWLDPVDRLPVCVSTEFARRPDQDESDLVVGFTVRRPRLGEHAERDVVTFEISVPRGPDLAAIPPLVLPRDRTSAEYEENLLDAVTQAGQLCASNAQAAIEALTAALDGPLFVGDVDVNAGLH
jgi:hypothetical protein